MCACVCVCVCVCVKESVGWIMTNLLGASLGFLDQFSLARYCLQYEHNNVLGRIGLGDPD